MKIDKSKIQKINPIMKPFENLFKKNRMFTTVILKYDFENLFYRTKIH